MWALHAATGGQPSAPLVPHACRRQMRSRRWRGGCAREPRQRRRRRRASTRCAGATAGAPAEGHCTSRCARSRPARRHSCPQPSSGVTARYCRPCNSCMAWVGGGGRRCGGRRCCSRTSRAGAGAACRQCHPPNVRDAAPSSTVAVWRAVGSPTCAKAVAAAVAGAAEPPEERDGGAAA